MFQYWNIDAYWARYYDSAQQLHREVNAIMEAEVNTTPTFAWHQLITHDLECTQAFYSDVFGWSNEIRKLPNHDSEDQLEEYHVFRHGRRFVAGVVDVQDIRDRPASPAIVVTANWPTRWVPFISINDMYQDSSDLYFQFDGKDNHGRFAWGLSGIPSIGDIGIVFAGDGTWHGVIDTNDSNLADTRPLVVSGSRSPWRWADYYPRNLHRAEESVLNILGLSCNAREMHSESSCGTFIRKGDVPVAGLMERSRLGANDGRHWPDWLCYVAVDNVAETCKRAEGAGGEVVHVQSGLNERVVPVICAPDHSMIGIMDYAQSLQYLPQVPVVI